MFRKLFLITCIISLLCAAALAQVMYDAGRMQINGIQLFQDYGDHTAYYYLPDAPRLSQNDDGTLDFLCLKYVDTKGSASGGLFHALVELTLSQDAVDALQKELQKRVPGAHIAGPVPLMAEKKEEGQPGSFELVSSILSDRGTSTPEHPNPVGSLTRSVVTSGTAPLVPGSRAAVAASLSPQGATLLWNSLSGPTSDVSIAINAYYEAVVTGFSAHVTADISTVYKHYSSIFNKQQDYTRRQIRDIADSLVRNGTIKVESFDRSALQLKNNDMSALLDMITQKLTELIFDHKSGFSADPEREPAVESGQLPGRQERSWLSRTFGGTDDTKYYTDDQWVLKDRTDIHQNIFSISLDKNSTIKVPFSTAGNIRGLYGALKDDSRYFRIVNLDDPAYQIPSVYFQVDGNYVDAFADTINFVAVNFRKKYQDPAHEDSVSALRIDSATLKNGDTVRSLSYPRLGESGPEAQQYDYQIVWSVRDRDSIRVPAASGDWLHAADPVVALTPPLQKTVIDLDADRQLFKDKKVQTAIVEFHYPLVGKPAERKATLRANDADSSGRVTLYRDRSGSATQMRITWYFKDGQMVRRNWSDLTDTSLVLTPPDPPIPPSPSPATPGGGTPGGNL
jgi:hypothetical protein